MPEIEEALKELKAMWGDIRRAVELREGPGNAQDEFLTEMDHKYSGMQTCLFAGLMWDAPTLEDAIVKVRAWHDSQPEKQ